MTRLAAGLPQQQIIRIIPDKHLTVNALVLHRLPYHEAGEAYRLLRDEKDKAPGIILDWQE